MRRRVADELRGAVPPSALADAAARHQLAAGASAAPFMPRCRRTSA